MAEREIVWTRRALQGKMDIMEYWYQKTGTVDYSVKLETLFSSSLLLVKNHPAIGPVFDNKRNIRCVVIRDYKVYYTFSDHDITVLAVWDTRRNQNMFEI